MQFIRERERDYPGIIEKVADRFLEEAGVIVEGAAKRLAPKDTGNLAGSINRRRENKLAEAVGTNVEYAEYQEYGTRFMKAHPYLRPAIDENRRNLIRRLRELVQAEIEFGRT